MTRKANSATEVLEPEAPGGAVKVTSVATTTRRFVEKPAAPATEPDEPIWEDASEEDDALADFFESSQDYIIRVERISEAYAQTGQTSMRTVGGVWCEDIPLTRDYRTVIKTNFGPGVYRLILKGGDRQAIRKHQILKIAAPMNNTLIPQPGQSHIRVMPGQSIDPIEVFKSQTLLVREFLKLSHELMPEPQAIVNPGASPELALQVAEQSGKLKVMETLLAHPDKDWSERLITKLFSGGEEKSSSIWPELIELGKVGLQLLSDSGLLKTLANQPAAQPDATATAPVAVPDSALRTPNPALPPDQRSPSQIAYARTIDIVTQGMYFDDMPGMAIAALDQLTTRYEEWGLEIDTMMLAREPAVVVETLIANTGLAQAPDDTKAHWAGWIARLQEQWKNEPGDEQEEAEHEKSGGN